MDIDFIRKMLPSMTDEHAQIALDALKAKVGESLKEVCPEEKVHIGFSLAYEHTVGMLHLSAELKDPYVCHGAASRLLGGLLRLHTVAVGADPSNIKDDAVMGDIYKKCEKAVYETLETELRALGLPVNTEYVKALPPQF